MTDTYLMKDGREVELRSDYAEDWEIWTVDSDPTQVGRFTFFHFSMPDGHLERDCYLVTEMDIGDDGEGMSMRGQGIGREIIRRMAADFPIYFARDNGTTRDDGAHLTGDGLPFAHQMIREGLASWE